MGDRKRPAGPASPPSGKRPIATSTNEALQKWWAETLALGKEACAPGKVLDLSGITQLHELTALRGPDASLKRLYVRRDFPGLYGAILMKGQDENWLGHISGNSGVGKSAFLWYFVVRFAIDRKSIGRKFRIVYQSGDYMWDFRSSGQASVAGKGEISPVGATWHLVDQKVEAGILLGARVLVAASPDRANLKSAKPYGTRSQFFVYPWEKDEFDELVKIWLKAADLKEELATALEVLATGEDSKDRVRASYYQEADDPASYYQEADDPDSYYQEADDAVPKDVEILAAELQAEAEETTKGDNFGARVWSAARRLRFRANNIRIRAKAADIYFSWFGGIVRLLWKLDPENLDDARLGGQVDVWLANTNLMKVVQAVQTGATSDDISWSLLHFKRPLKVNYSDYLLQFASSKVKDKFNTLLFRCEAEELKFLLHSADPHLGALRGYIFEQEVVGQLQKAKFDAVLMIDNKHCQICNSREDKSSHDTILWVACDRCRRWYHQACVNVTDVMAMLYWRCEKEDCSLKAPQPVPRGGLSLMYYDGELKEALLAAGADAKRYVWRPLKSNNAAFDFAILPRTFGNATTAANHPIQLEAVQNGVSALRAWNEAYNQGGVRDGFLLLFFLMQENFISFGYQSYRDKLRRVTKKGVKDLHQGKVMVPTFGEERGHSVVADIVPPATSVEKLDDLFEEKNFQDFSLEELQSLAVEWGMVGYSALSKAALIKNLEEAWKYGERCAL